MKKVPVLFAILFAVLCSGSLPLSAQERNSGNGSNQHVITNEAIPFKIELRGLVKAAKSEALLSPAWYKPVKYVVKDGSFVKKGQVVAEFDPMYEDQQYQRRLIEKEAVDLELQGKLLDIDNKAQSFNDSIKEKQGKLKVLQAKLQRLQSLPLESDVLIAKGKLRIARLEYDEANDVWQRAQARFKKGYLSQTELQRYAYNQRTAKATFDNRKTRYQLTQAKTPLKELLIAELNIKNVELELQKVVFENEKQKKFISLNKTGAERRMKRFVRNLKKTEKMLGELVITSPADGFVVYSRRFKRDLRDNGGKMRKGRIFAEIPHVDSLYIQVVLPEQYRQLVAVGNSCLVSTLGNSAHSYGARISAIDQRPRDISNDEDNIRWGKDRESGVKVYNVKVAPRDSGQALRPGTHSLIQITGETRQGPAIPLRFVVIKDQQYYLSFDGVYTVVEGSPVNGWLMLSDQSLLDKTVLLTGEFPLQTKDDSVLDDNSGQLVVGGEISPIKEYDVMVGDIQRDTKVAVLAEEGILVEKGDVIMELGETETVEAMGKVEEDLNNAISQREKEEEQIMIIKTKGEIDLQLRKNSTLIAQARLGLEKSKTNKKMLAIADRTMEVVIARINTERSESELRRLQKIPTDRVSQTDMSKAKRDFLRKSLRQEKSEIRLYLEENAYDYRALKQAEKNLLQEQLNLQSKSQRLQYELSVGSAALAKARSREQKMHERFDKYKVKKTNLIVTAPYSGVLQYKVIWDSGKLGKVASGSTMRHYMRPLSIADYSKMVINLELPETVYASINTGQQVEVTVPSLENKLFIGQVEDIKYIFKNKTRKDIQLGLYSDREPLGKSTFSVKILLDIHGDKNINPGMHVRVRFPVAWPPEKSSP